FLLGVPGSGKSFLAKQMIMSLLLGTDDDILICDPEGEYVPIAKAAGEQGRTVRISAHSGDRINPMYMDPDDTDGSSVIMKSELIQSLIERIEERPITARQRSVIDRCIRKVYRDCRRTGMIPTLTLLRDELLRQNEPEASETALSLEIYTDGSLRIFAGEGDYNSEGRLTVFDIHEMEENLKAAGFLIITDTMLNRVNRNSREGRRTHIFIDEFHVVFSNSHSARFFSSAWRQFRKRNAYPTAITQNVDTVLESPEARSMLSNSEFVIMLSQAASDREKLAELLRISEDQLRYLSIGGSGCGLMKYGGALVPFVNRLPKDTGLYSLMTTTPGEKRFY
ncbi:MAG: ATP-binding protein, partial [Oscillospiraceae bacterium]|nr:ATP-binding protein [Oscillospiraceae bacterium]